MKMKYHFETIIVDDAIRMIPVGGEVFNGVLTVNETMKDIMDLLAEERTESEVVSAMLERYEDVTREEMTTAVRHVCASLREEGLLAE